MINYKLTISYNGTAFHGYQYQPNARTIEGELKSCLDQWIGKNYTLVASGRTDAGVHSEGQVLSLKTDKVFENQHVLKTMNAMLDDSVVVKSCEKVKDTFHARFSAISREYRYFFTNHQLPWYYHQCISTIKHTPNLELLNTCAALFIGEHDFKHFRKLGSNEKNTVRQISTCEFQLKEINTPYNERCIPYIEFRVVANAFLYRMVRNLVGAMLQVSANKMSLELLKDYFNNGNNKFIFKAADPQGLCLYKVSYE